MLGEEHHQKAFGKAYTPSLSAFNSLVDTALHLCIHFISASSVPKALTRPVNHGHHAVRYAGERRNGDENQNVSVEIGVSTMGLVEYYAEWKADEVV